MHYGLHSTDIVGYAYQADTYCPGCIAHMLRKGPLLPAEDAIAALLTRRGLDPSATHDTDIAPFPIFASDDAYDNDGRPHCCLKCLEPLIDA